MLQEQSRSCEEILRLAECGRIQLVLPSYSLIEPYGTLFRRGKGRRRIWEKLNDPIKQIARNKKLKTQLHDFEKITELLLRAVEDDKMRLKAVRSRLLESACVIPMDTSVLRAAEKYELELKLEPQDAHIFSAILSNLRVSEDRVNCFLNHDRKDFLIPDIVTELKSYGCKLIPRFDRGHEYILSEVG